MACAKTVLVLQDMETDKRFLARRVQAIKVQKAAFTVNTNHAMQPAIDVDTQPRNG
jgi:hypothetical protein